MSHKSFRQIFNRAFCLPTLMSVIGIGCLLSLGTWQLYRLEWKQSLQQQLTKVLGQPAQHLEDFIQENSAPPQEFQKIVVTGTFDPTRHLKWMARTHEGQHGYHLIVPFHLSMGATILVDRGWVPQGVTAISLPKENETLTLMVRYGQIPSLFTPESNMSKGEIYHIEPKEIARDLELMTLLPYYGILLNPPQDMYPIVSEPQLSLRNHHLSYALTWYALALALAVIYVIYIRKQQLSF